MKIGLCSKLFKTNNIDYNLSVILNTFDEVLENTDLICFGEAFIQGFESLIWDYEIDKLVAIDQNSDYIKTIINKAKQCKIAVSFGYIEIDNDKLYSSYMTISKDGIMVNNYRRVSIGWKEVICDDIRYCEGVDFSVFTLLNKKIIVGLCGDFWSDESIEALNKNNFDIVLWPVFINYTKVEWVNHAKKEYANQALKIADNVLMINSICNDRKNKAIGASTYFKNGVVIGETLPNVESILYLDV